MRSLSNLAVELPLWKEEHTGEEKSERMQR